MTTEVKFTQANPSFFSAKNEEKEGIVTIKGFAVHEGTFNNITILKDELTKSVASLIGSPILKNHDNDIDVIVGKITKAECKIDPDCGEYGIAYEAEIDEKEEELIRKMQLDFIGSVSVGFRCEHICSICGEPVFACDHWFWDDGFQILAKDITFHELSIVAVPADLNATVKVNFANDSDKLKFEDLEKFKEERRTTMSDFEKKYTEVVEEFNNFKMEKVEEVNKMKEEFKATKEKLEADKADKVEEVLGLKAEIETLQQDKEALESKVSEFEETFKQIEEEKLSGLREEVEKLNEKVNGDLTKEEIDSFEEATLNRYVQTFSHIAEHMVKVTKPVDPQKNEQYKAGGTDEDVSLAEKLTGNLRDIRGF